MSHNKCYILLKTISTNVIVIEYDVDVNNWL